MKKAFHLFTLLAILLPILFAFPVYAQGPIMTVALQGAELPNAFTLSQLGYDEKPLVGPFDSRSINFSLPGNVRLAPGSSLSLRYALAWSAGSISPESIDAGISGTLLVYFNDELIDTIILTSNAPLEEEILIPVSVLNRVNEQTGSYNLRFFLDAEANCDIDGVRTTVIINKNSQLNFQYELIAPVADLTLFPRPIFQPNSILPSSALVVIPEDPEIFEIQAALTVMTGLGTITNGELNVALITRGGLSETSISTNHLIFVGLADKFSDLQVVDFPVPISANGLGLGQENSADGAIQIAVSPWSQSSIVMFVGGNTQEAVVKASQAYSTGRLVAVEQRGLSLVSVVNPFVDSVVQENQSFKGLGYEDQTMGLYGENYLEYIFFASPEQAVSEGSYLDMVLSHSNLLDLNQTGITVILNDEVVAGLQLPKESPITERINLVPGALRKGFNRLEIVSDIRPSFSCYSEDLLSTWVTISSTSVLHLPISTIKLDFDKNANLRDFPYIFLNGRDLSDLAFVLDPGDPISWSYAAQAAYVIGARGGIPLANLSAMFADEILEDTIKDYNLLVFGRPGSMPFIAGINDLLPAPFKPGTDEAVQPSMLVNYSLLPDTSVGYLQLLESPWNPDRVILVVSGNNPDGLPMAGAALLSDEQVSRLSGNFAVLYSDQIVSTDTRLGLAKESIIAQLPVAVTVTPAVETTVPQFTNVQIESRPDWILPTFAVVTVGIVIMLAVVLRRELSSKATPKEGKGRDDTADSSIKQS